MQNRLCFCPHSKFQTPFSSASSVGWSLFDVGAKAWNHSDEPETVFLCVDAVFLCLRFVTAGEVQFNRDIRPILSEKCYFCHGPDANHREADLRFDTPDGAEDSIRSGEFLARILSEDPDLVMPKPASKLTLSESEKELLRRWVGSGAKYDTHWAFVPLPQEVPVPLGEESQRAERNRWVKQPFDYFIARSIRSMGWKLPPPPRPIDGLRRVTIDLTDFHRQSKTSPGFRRSNNPRERRLTPRRSIDC